MEAVKCMCGRPSDSCCLCEFCRWVRLCVNVHLHSSTSLRQCWCVFLCTSSLPGAIGVMQLVLFEWIHWSVWHLPERRRKELQNVSYTVTTSYQRYWPSQSMLCLCTVLVCMYVQYQGTCMYVARLQFYASAHISPTKCNNFVCLWGLIDW